jgi:hypothetical protein
MEKIEPDLSEYNCSNLRSDSIMTAISQMIRNDLRLPFLPVILTPFILFAGPLITGQTLFWGLPALQFVPWQSYAFQQISQGILPLWNPLNGMGTPLMANYQLALFYPPTWFGYIFAAIGGTSALAWVQTLLIPLHLVWAGIGMILLSRRLGFNILAQTISGLCFAMSGYFVARSGFYSMIWAAAWLPWIIWSASAISMPVKGVVSEHKGISVALVACLTFQLLAGHAQLAWYTIVLVVIWVFVGGWVNRGWKGALQSSWVLFYHGVIAVGISAIQLLPTAEYLISSQRSTAVDFESGLTYSFWPWRLLTLLAPKMFGDPGSGNYWGYASFWEDAVYIGMLPLALGITTLLKIGRGGYSDPRQPLIRLAWSTAMVGLLFALGNNTPIFPFLYDHIPTFSLFNAPARWMIWFVFMLSLLAGIGAMGWARPAGKALRRFRRLTAAALAVTLGAVITWVLLRDVKITFIEATAFMGIWATGVCFLTLRKPIESNDPKAHFVWQWTVAGWLVLDLLWANWLFQPVVPVDLFSNSFAQAIGINSAGRVVMDAQLEYDLKFHRFFRFADYTPIEDWIHLREVALPNMNLLPSNQFQYVNNFDPIVQDRFAKWMAWVADLPVNIRDEVYQLMDVGVIIERDITDPLGVTPTTARNADRIRWFSCADFLPDDASVWGSLQAIGNSSDASILFRKVILETVHPGPETDCTTAAPVNMSIVSDTPESLRVQIDTKGSGYLFLADSWYPGWTANVDGVETQIYKADVVFRAVWVQPGSHMVDFIYQPKSFYIGLGITIITLVFLAFIFLFSKHRVK